MVKEKKTSVNWRLTTRLFIACGVIGPLLFVVVFLIEGVTRSHYSVWHNFVSDLSLGQQGWEQIGNFLICGVFVLCFAVGLRQVLQSGRGSLWGPMLFGLFGVGLIVVGLFVTDPVNGPQTFHGTIHNDITPIVFISVIAACFVLARRFAGHPNWKGWVPYSLVTGILVGVFFIATNVVATLDQKGILHGAPVGLLQRTAIIIGWGWIALFAFRLLRKMQSSVSAPHDRGEQTQTSVL